MSLTISINLENYKGKCPLCLIKLKNYPKGSSAFKNYNIYLTNAELIFGKWSLPLCYPCWYNYEPCCDNGCFIPFPSSLFASELGNQTILSKTTIVQPAVNNNEHRLCVKCYNDKCKDHKPFKVELDKISPDLGPVKPEDFPTPEELILDDNKESPKEVDLRVVCGVNIPGQ